MRDRYTGLMPRSPSPPDVLRLAFLGELAQAQIVSKQLGTEGEPWLEWLELLLEESPIQRWLAQQPAGVLSEEAAVGQLCTEVLMRAMSRSLLNA